MRFFTRLGTVAIFAVAAMSGAQAASIEDSIGNENRADANRERDGDRKPDQVLEFIGLGDGAVVLDWGAGGGYWAELFAGVVGSDGKVYAHQNAGERFESQKAAYEAQFGPFGNIELLPLARGAAIGFHHLPMRCNVRPGTKLLQTCHKRFAAAEDKATSGYMARM